MNTNGAERSGWAFALAVLAVWLGVVVAVGVTRSAWLDEFFIFNVTSPGETLASAYQHWRFEPHPPTYTFLVWLWRHVVEVAGSPFAVRALGVALSTVLALGAFLSWRASQRPGLGVFALLLLSLPIALFFPQEARSYFLSIFGGAYASLFFLSAIESPEAAKPRGHHLATGVIGAFLLGTHLMSIMFGGLLFAVMTIVLIRMKRWAWLRATLVIGGLVLGSAALFTLLTILDGLNNVMGGFWITRRHLLETALRLPANIGVPVVAVIAAALISFRKLKDWPDRAALGLILIIAGCVLALAVLSLIKPVLIVRYLCAPIAALVPPAALIAARFLARHPLPPARNLALAAGALATAFVSGWLTQGPVAEHAQWRRTADAVNAAPACEGAVIPYLMMKHAPDAKNPWAYVFAYYAPDHRFAPATPDVLASAGAQACPVRLWAAEVEYPADKEYADAVRAVCAGGRRVSLELSNGYLVVDQDARELVSRWPGKVLACEAIRLS